MKKSERLTDARKTFRIIKDQKKIADLNVLLDLAEEALGKHSINQTSARETLAVIKSGRKMIEVK